MNAESTLTYSADLQMLVTRANGDIEHYDMGSKLVTPKLAKPLSWYEKLWAGLKREGKIPATMAFGVFVAHLLHDNSGVLPAIMTTAGINYQATTFTSSSNPNINFNFHDMGTGNATAGTKTVSAATNASPIQITATSHGYGTNDLVTIASVGGNTNANGIWQITVLTANTFQLIGSTGNSAYTSGGTAQLLNGAGDTALTTSAVGAGLSARVAGTQSNPSANIYKSVATLSFTASLTLSEWGIFSASTSGTLLDRRWFNTAGAPATTASAALVASTIGVNGGDSVTPTYQLSLVSGGS